MIPDQRSIDTDPIRVLISEEELTIYRHADGSQIDTDEYECDWVTEPEWFDDLDESVLVQVDIYRHVSSETRRLPRHLADLEDDLRAEGMADRIDDAPTFAKVDPLGPPRNTSSSRWEEGTDDD